MSLHSVVREPSEGSRDTAPTVVLLHGVGSNERDLLGLASMLDPRFRFVSVRAPLTLGPDSYGWYRVQFTPDGFLIDDDEARAGLAALLDFLDTLPGPVWLMGFSQGCIMSLGALLTRPAKVLGVVGMSGRLLDSLLDSAAPPESLAGKPVMVVHGTRDQVIPVGMGRQIRDRLSSLPIELTYREYDMAHHVTQESVGDIAHWLARHAFAERG